ncbi:hypothetical protein C1895_19965 [Pseudomonas sp. FW305-3-2-15-E-TSA4]|nr:hypothetical protein C1895_19965 [Pseudomonas sp. FW305-3-2-15-E-TSA4]
MPVDASLADPPHSRAGSLPQGFCVASESAVPIHFPAAPHMVNPLHVSCARTSSRWHADPFRWQPCDRGQPRTGGAVSAR